LHASDFNTLRQTVLQNVNRRRVKISGFLQESLQEANSSIRVNNNGRVLAYGFDRPG
ncbi:hypothetical protein Pmar_PMAR014160, partial [Perkinsus marinus ATCC 50983]